MLHYTILFIPEHKKSYHRNQTLQHTCSKINHIFNTFSAAMFHNSELDGRKIEVQMDRFGD